MSGAKYITEDYDPRFLMHDSSKSPLRDAIKILKATADKSLNEGYKNSKSGCKIECNPSLNFISRLLKKYPR